VVVVLVEVLTLEAAVASVEVLTLEAVSVGFTHPAPHSPAHASAS
jgi:hypothetical protein